MARGIRPYGSGKFNTILDSYVYGITLDGGADEEISLGDGNGWYGFVGFDEKTADAVRRLAAEEKDELTPAEEKQLTFTSAVILFERSDGIVEISWFDNPEEAKEEWTELEEEFSEEDDEEEPEESEEEDDVFSDEEMAQGYVISDARGGGYNVTHEHQHFDHYRSIENALEEINDEMEREKFYPNIYYVNDHGNVDLLDQDGNVVKSRV